MFIKLRYTPFDHSGYATVIYDQERKIHKLHKLIKSLTNSNLLRIIIRNRLHFQVGVNYEEN